MILLHRLNGKEFYINPDVIKTAEETPDVVLTLTTDEKIMIKDPMDVVVSRIIEFRKQIFYHPIEAMEDIKDKSGR